MMSTQAPDRLRTEYAANPLGIDGAPRFSWDLSAEQTAYRVTAASTEALLAADAPDLWDSGRVASGEHLLIPYQGKPLASGQRVHWRVTTWDAAGVAGTSAAAWFEMGLLDKADWQGAFISFPCDGGGGRGYHSRVFKSGEAFELWAALDLGQTESFDRIVLQPTWCPEIGLSDGRGYGFPRRFRCELADSADFAGAVVIYESPAAIDAARWRLDGVAGRRGTFLPDDLPRPEPVAIQLPASVTGRCFRLVVTEPFRSKSGDAIFSLDEIELVSGGRNVALGKRAFAPNSHYRQAGIEIGSYDWHVDCLTDGLVHVRDVRRDRGGGSIARKEFTLAKPVARARAYVASKGWYELHLNGTRVGDAALDSAWTAFDKRLLYSTWDVTSLLRQGANAACLMLGNGWTLEPAAILQLNIEHPDGSQTAVVSDGAWRRLPGPVRANHLFHGEIYDARAHDSAMFLPGFDDRRFPPTPVLAGYAPELSARMMPPIRVVEEVEAVSVSQPEKGVFVFDLGKDISGWPRLKVGANAQTEVVLRVAETIYDDGSVWTDAKQTAARRSGTLAVADGMINVGTQRTGRSTDRYIPCGDGREAVWEPRFLWHGFRFVEVSGYPGQPGVGAITGRRVCTDAAPASAFECSNALLNWLFEATRLTLMNNLMSLPTDTHQRDERQGWGGNSPFESLLYACDAAPVYAKWIRDARDCQRADGAFPDSVPFSLGRMGGDIVTGGTWLFAAWHSYLFTGDIRFLAENFEAMHRYLRFLEGQCPSGHWTDNLYGDWLGLEKTPGAVVDNAMWYRAATMVACAAEILGRHEAAAECLRLAEKIAAEFNARLLRQDNSFYGGQYYGSGSQASDALPLAVGLVPEQSRLAVFNDLVENVESRGRHLSTGITATDELLEVLSENGRSDLAYAIATQEEYPGWGFMRRHGATTIWEHWKHLTGSGGMDSHCHEGLARGLGWLMKYILGIRPDPAAPGFRKIILAPCFPAGLEFARGSYRAITGTIACAWQRKDGKILLECAVPHGTTATLRLPPGIRLADSGTAEGHRDAPREVQLAPGGHGFRLLE